MCEFTAYVQNVLTWIGFAFFQFFSYIHLYTVYTVHIQK